MEHDEDSQSEHEEDNSATMNGGSPSKYRKGNHGNAQATTLESIPPQQLSASQLRWLAQQCFRRASQVREDGTWLIHPHTADNVDYLSSFGIHVNDS